MRIVRILQLSANVTIPARAGRPCHEKTVAARATDDRCIHPAGLVAGIVVDVVSLDENSIVSGGVEAEVAAKRQLIVEHLSAPEDDAHLRAVSME